MSKFNKIIFALILLAVFSSILETEKTFRDYLPNVFRGLNFLFITVFSLEYLVRFWVAGEREKYRGLTGRIKFVFSLWSIVDLLAIVPFIFTLGASDTLLLRIFRVCKLFTLTKLGKHSKALNNIVFAISTRKYELLWSLAAAFFVMISAATVLYLTESKANPEDFGSIPRALWWGAATITKVGYGGAFPVTFLGKLFAVIFAIGAVGIVAVPTGIIAGSFFEAFSKKQ